MTQVARPDADAHDGAWTKSTGGNTDMYAMIDEAVADDTDYIQSELAPASSPVVVRLGDVNDPGVHHSHEVRYRYRKQPNGDQIDIVVQLRQGYVNEASPGTLIASQTHANASANWTAAVLALTTTEAGNITDYTDLWLRATANQP